MCHSSYGGSPRIAISSAMELAGRGHTIHIFARTPPHLFVKTKNNITCHTVYPENDPMEHPAYLKIDWSDDEYDRMRKRIIAVHKKNGLDILHIHYALPFIAIAKAVKAELGERAPAIILTLHGTDVIRLSDIDAAGSDDSSPKSASFLACCDSVTTVSTSHAELFSRLSGSDIQPAVIPNFTDLSHFFPKSLSVKNAKPVIIHVSNFRAIKNPCGVIDIFSGLLEKIDAVLWLVGDGEEMDKVNNLVEKKGLSSNVKFFGLVPNIAKLISRADVLVMTSIYESFCLTALESMACGVPVLAPRVGGIPELITHGKTGFLFSPNDYAEAAELAVGMLSKAGLYARISTNALRRAHAFDQKKIVTLYEKLYSRVRFEKQLQRHQAPPV